MSLVCTSAVFLAFICSYTISTISCGEKMQGDQWSKASDNCSKGPFSLERARFGTGRPVGGTGSLREV
ncbi:hypothetical protein GBAR_LOCUS4486 [Geodia barretti]|uniref:Secreted protein n=1 Tax=Geodia barretti TaxID=519541 RepID=A0AA35R6Y3_GEOBA|nr:hypothetical protein GBAR_LOCUS4486 [Geodia barretti]